MRRLSLHFLLPSLIGLVACAPQTKAVRPDWQNPGHRIVGEQMVALLRSAGRSPADCKVFFLETEKLNAVSAGECKFGFTTGLADTRDDRLIRGVAAHEVAHEVLGHADKRKAAIATEQVIRTGVSLIPGVGGLIASSAVLVAGLFALPAYSRSQEAEADAKAVEILKGANDPDPPGAMAYSFRTLLSRYGAKGGGLLDDHPGTEARLEAMLKLQREQPPVEPAPQPELADARTPSAGQSSVHSPAFAPTPSLQNAPDQPSHDEAKTETTAKTESSPVGGRRGKDDAEMLYIPAGTFTMGDTHGDGGPDEKPAHVVSVGAFWLDRTEVTNAQFARFIQATSYRPQGRWQQQYAQGMGRHPVAGVTWHDAVAYCSWAAKRLPTEAEWEYAARGTDDRKYPWGNTWEEGRARHPRNPYREGTAPVGSYPTGASPFGILDLAGNVSEWVSSAYKPYPYVADDGREDTSAAGVRVTRGGSYIDYSGYLRSVHRDRLDSLSGRGDVGFRCAQGPSDQ